MIDRAFPARYDGRCAADCEDRVHPGDMIRKTDDGIVHDQCAPPRDPTELGPREVVCGTCWLVKPCKCDE